MRLHALRLQGLRAPQGIQAIPIDLPYTALRGPEPALRGVLEVILALLAPERALGRLARVRDPHAGVPTRVAMNLELGEEVYRVAADVDEERVVLARFDPGERRFVRVAAEPAAAERILREAGVPEPELFEALAVVPLASVRAPPPSAEPRRRDASGRELAALQQSRRELLAERGRLETTTPSPAPWIFLGLALVAYGAVGAFFIDPLLWVLGGLGLLAIGIALGARGRGRHRLSGIDARLSALRLRERTIERRLESEEGPETRLARMLECGARFSGESEKELRAELHPTLSIYLAAVSGGRPVALVDDDRTGSFALAEPGGARALAELPQGERLLVELAFQLALLERLAGVRPLPALVGPPRAGEGGPAALAAVLARLARVAQVVELTEGNEPWRPVAPRVHTLG